MLPLRSWPRPGRANSNTAPAVLAACAPALLAPELRPCPTVRGSRVPASSSSSGPAARAAL
eukprot:15458997-Alexandrium_andersonii.AAC.1